VKYCRSCFNYGKKINEILGNVLKNAVFGSDTINGHTPDIKTTHGKIPMGQNPTPNDHDRGKAYIDK